MIFKTNSSFWRPPPSSPCSPGHIHLISYQLSPPRNHQITEKLSSDNLSKPFLSLFHCCRTSLYGWRRIWKWPSSELSTLTSHHLDVSVSRSRAAFLAIFWNQATLRLVLMLTETYRFPSEAWLTAVHKLGLDGVHIELLASGDLIQVFVPVLKTQLRSISSSRKGRLSLLKKRSKMFTWRLSWMQCQCLWWRAHPWLRWPRPAWTTCRTGWAWSSSRPPPCLRTWRRGRTWSSALRHLQWFTSTQVKLEFKLTLMCRVRLLYLRSFNTQHRETILVSVSPLLSAVVSRAYCREMSMDLKVVRLKINIRL